MLSGCATRATIATYGPAGDLLKTTTVHHSWWLGLPALAPMDWEFKDGEFSSDCKSVDLNNIVNMGARK